MNRLLPGLAGILVVLAIIWVIWPDQAEETGPPSSSVKITAPAENVLEATIAQNSKSASSESSDDEAMFDPYEDEAIRAQMMQVADLYEDTSKYPHFSQPITNPDTVKEIEPFEETETDTPFPSDEYDEPIRLLASVDRYQYFQGETISVRLRIVGAPSDTFINASATVGAAQNDAPLSTPLNPTSSNYTEFVGSLDTNVVPAHLLTTEMLLKVNVTIGEESMFTTVPFRYSQASAQLVTVPYSRIESEYLLIPLQYTVYRPGYYFANAILDDAGTGQPLLRLQAEGPMNQGNGVLMLKAHVRALKKMGSSGPYTVRSVKTYRGAEDGEVYDLPASGVRQRFEVQGFPFEQYEDSPYQDELAAERLEFLRNLGAVEDSSDE
ncbi:MAG: hypothetical protein AAF431_16745 [Pseudomonadota bacterium]